MTALTPRDRKRKQFWHVYDCPVTGRNILSRHLWHNLAASSKLFSLSSSQPHTHTVCLFLSLSFTYPHISVSPIPGLSERGPYNFIIHCILPLARLQLKKTTSVNTEPQTFTPAWGGGMRGAPCVGSHLSGAKDSAHLDLWGQKHGLK